MVQFEYNGVTQTGEVLEVKANGDRTLRLDDGSIVSIARRNWKPLQKIATLNAPTLNVPTLNTSESADAVSDSDEPAASVAPKKLPVDTWMKAALVVVAAAIIMNE